MSIGFVTAILGDLSFEDVLKFASDEGFAHVEVMCWPPGKADRRYAGVTHIDVTDFSAEKAGPIVDMTKRHGVGISGLGYYPNPLDPDPVHRNAVVEHLKKVIRAAPMLNVNVVNTFIGRDWAQTSDANLLLMRIIWDPIIEHARNLGVRIGIEHCPMLFGNDEWPGGKNVANCPAVWRKMFDAYPAEVLGLNFDPSHLVYQFIDTPRAIREFGSRIFHVHAKDERIDREKLYETGIMGLGWHKPKLPGLGDVNWGEFFAALTDSGYKGPISIEVEDRAYEGSLAERKRAIRQSKKFLEQFIG